MEPNFDLSIFSEVDCAGGDVFRGFTTINNSYFFLIYTSPQGLEMSAETFPAP